MLKRVDCALTILEANEATQRAQNAHLIALGLSMIYVAPYRLLRDDVRAYLFRAAKARDRWALFSILATAIDS